MPSCSSCAFDAASDVAACPRCGSTLDDPLVGAVLGQRYRIVSRIGAGGMGAVYRAEHIMMKRELAIKVLHPELGGRDEFVRRFEREAQSASRLAHPNIINATDFGRTETGLLFLAMEYLAGRSLTSLIKEGPLPLGRALGIIRQVLAGLTHAHAAGVVHRDLKPDNIMLVERDGSADNVKILDFGIAKMSAPLESMGGREALTQAGVIFGTPDYLSPEQALGEAVDARADVYAAGVILFEMLVGRRPYESEDKVRIISMHLSHPLPRMRDLSPKVDVPLPIEQAVLQALEKQREHRFASAAAFRAALEDGAALAATAGHGGEAATTVANHAAWSPDHTGWSPPAQQIPGGTPAPAATMADAGAGAAATRDPAPSGRGSTGRHRRGRVLLAVAVIALLAGGVTLYARRAGRGGPDAAGHSLRPAPPSAALAAQLRGVEGMLAAGEIVKSRVALEQLLAEHPDAARIRYLLGRLAFADDRHGEALASYRDALIRDPGFRGDPVMLEHLGVALGEHKLADEALDLIIERVGRPALSLLERVANDGPDLRRRQRAARALDQMGEGRRVDRVELWVAELKRADTCEEKKPLVVELGRAADVRALPALRAQRSRGGISRLFGREDQDSGCMKTELGNAIAALEAKLSAKQQTKQQAVDTEMPGQGAPARRSLFRGR
jgi:tRNA A-37 threonylcarbamoyl transferase component Bud32